MTIHCLSQDELSEVAFQIITHAQNKKIWVFDGEMGAGKTTLIKAICQQLRVVDETSSPTFSLVNVYENDEGEELYHFDFYRINHEVEALDIGCDEYFYSDNLCFLEWAERIPSLIPSKYLKISIKLGVGSERIISLTHHD